MLKLVPNKALKAQLPEPSAEQLDHSNKLITSIKQAIKANNNSDNISNYIVLLTSGNILDNFYKKLSDDLKPVMLDAKIIVPSSRVATKAKDIGFKNIYCANSMNEQIILDMIKTKLRKVLLQIRIVLQQIMHKNHHHHRRGSKSICCGCRHQ